MSLSISLNFGDNSADIYTKEYIVASCKYKFTKHYNPHTHTIDGLAECGVIDISLIAPDKDSLDLYEWYLDRTILSGKITFNFSTLSAKQNSDECKTLYFENTHCFHIEEKYSILSKHKRILHLKLIAEEITIDSVSYSINNI